MRGIEVVRLMEDYAVVEVSVDLPCPHCIDHLAKRLEKAFQGANVVFLAGTCEATWFRNGNCDHIWYNEGNPAKPLTFPPLFSEFKIAFIEMRFKNEALDETRREVLNEEGAKLLFGK